MSWNYEHNNLKEKVNKLLDEVERPVGTLKARLPQNEHTERALMELFHAIERTP